MPCRDTQVPFRIVCLKDLGGVFDSSWTKLCGSSSAVVLSPRARLDVRAAFVEAVANAERHAGELTRRGEITGRFFLNQRHVGFEVEDHGRGFRLDKVPVPNWTDLKGSGRGVFIMRQLGDDLTYMRSRKRNVLAFKRFLLGPNAPAREIDLLYDLSDAVIRGANLDEVCKIILDQALGIFHVERASILMHDEAINRLKVVASRGLSGEVRQKTRIRAGEGVSGYVFQHGRPLLIENIDSNRRGIERKKGYKSGSFISAPMIRAPLRADEKPVGVINLTDRIDGKPFTKKDLKVLSTIANQAMACLNIRDLMDSAGAAEQFKRDLETVRRIQMSYLPTAAPSIPGFDMAGACDMAQSVGGDYYDFFSSERWFYVVVADVSGHDINSAMTMFNFRSRLRTLFTMGIAPDDILTRLNADMHDDLASSETFVSAVVMRVDTASGDFELSSAGHYSPLWSEGEICRVDAGLVLGIEAHESYPMVRGKLGNGQVCLLFTDGVVEAMDGKGEFFGMARLKALASRLSREPAGEIVTRVIRETLDFRAAGTILDDITVVAVRHE